MKTKRILTALLASLMLTSMFAGCGSTSTDTGADTTAGGGEATQAEETTTVAETVKPPEVKDFDGFTVSATVMV